MASFIRVGMVGLDTSHCPTFTRLLNDENDVYHVPGAKVVGAFPGGSTAFSLSYSRVEGFTEQLREGFGVTMYDSIPPWRRMSMPSCWRAQMDDNTWSSSPRRPWGNPSFSTNRWRPPPTTPARSSNSPMRRALPLCRLRHSDMQRASPS